jgi:hypothetical protein
MARTDLLDVNDIAYIFEEIWQGKSAFSNSQDRALVMTRWDRSKPSSLTNTILVTKEEAKKHEALSLEINLQAHYGPSKLMYHTYNKILNFFKLRSM